MRSESTLRRWVRDLRKLIDDSPKQTAETRIAYAMETALRVALSKPRDFRDYNPVKDAKIQAQLLAALGEPRS
jgi:hypothetical protein